MTEGTLKANLQHFVWTGKPRSLTELRKMAKRARMIANADITYMDEDDEDIYEALRLYR